MTRVPMALLFATSLMGQDAGNRPTVNLFFDGYYSWNVNRPQNRTNALRAYDTSSNSFALSQVGIVVEQAPEVAKKKPFGYRLDLMFGPATETLQGSPANENRPQIYRNIFQAYGTYIVPVGSGLTVDFGKWASALGPEGNYAKDQINYSRSYFFNYLPFYHMGVRTTYNLNKRVSAAYWLVNGANQTEDFNGFKSQLAQVVVKPGKNISWTANYYAGQEQRASNGRMHILDTYAFWNVTEKLTVGGELDYVISRIAAHDAPQRVTGGAAYLRLQLMPRVYFGQRYTRLNDLAGLFSGVSQKLNDLTSTVGFRPREGFEVRGEYRRDFSDVAYFTRREPAMPLSKHQETFTVGLLWWFGGKTGSW